jgi:hypothetical protein
MKKPGAIWTLPEPAVDVEGRQADRLLDVLADDDAVVEQVAILEERVLVDPVALARARLRVRVDDGGVVLTVAELLLTDQEHVVFAAVLQLVRLDARVALRAARLMRVMIAAESVIALVTFAHEDAKLPATRLAAALPNSTRSALSVTQVLRCAAVAASNRMPLTRWPAAEPRPAGCRFGRQRIERVHHLEDLQLLAPVGQERLGLRPQVDRGLVLLGLVDE